MRPLHAIEQSRRLLYEIDAEGLAHGDPDAAIAVEHLPSDEELVELHAMEQWALYRAYAGLPPVVIPAHVSRVLPPRAALVCAVVLERGSATSDADILAAFPRPGVEPPDGVAEACVAALASGIVVQDQDGALWGAGRRAA